MNRLSAIETLHAATALYTVAEIVDALLDRLDWPDCGGRLLDPSAGDGSFILQALRRLDTNDVTQLDRIQGWEIHPGAASTARTRVAGFLRQSGLDPHTSHAAASRIVINKDFLTHGPTHEHFHTIAGNPPYLRFQRLPDYFKQVYGRSLPKYASQDLLHAFLDRCVGLLNRNGSIGLVCSDRFLFNSTAGELRHQLGTRVGIEHLTRLEAKTAFYRPKQRVKGSAPRIHPVEIVLRHPSNSKFAITREPIVPDELGRPPTTGPTLGDIAKISLAPWLGPFGIFVVSEATAACLRNTAATLIPAVDTDDIDPQTDELRGPSRFVIVADKLHQPTGLLDAHLQAQLHRMPKRGLKPKYWHPPEPVHLPLDTPTLLIPRIARRIRAVPLPANVLAINHNLSVISTSDLSLIELRQLLLAESSQAWIQRNAPRLESGFFSISTQLLRRMPI